MGVELLADGVSEDAVLHGDLVAAGGAARGVNGVERSKFQRVVIENHIGGVAHVNGVFAGIGEAAGADAQAADNVVRPRAEGNFVADDGDATGRGLSSDVKAAGAGHGV